MSFMKPISALALSLCLFAAIPAFAQDTEVKQQVRVRVRLLPVTVKGADGAPLKGLKAEDFELRVDGKSVPVRGVDEYDYGVIREEMRQGRKPQITGDSIPARRFILVFDIFSSNWREDSDATDQPARARGIQMSKAAAREWAEKNLLPTDEVAVIGYNFGPQLIQPYTTKKESILKAIDQVQLPLRMMEDMVDLGDNEAGGEREQGRITNITLDNPSIQQMRQGTKSYLDFYNRLGLLLASLPGTKNVILFSEGIAVHQGNQELSYHPEMQRATAALGSSATRIAAVNIAGMERSRGSYQDEFLNGMARETGGEYFPSRGRLNSALDAATATFDHFYEVFFSPEENENADFHAVEVTVKRPRATAAAPRGYLGEKQFDLMSDSEREVAIDQGFWRPLLANDLGAEFVTAVLPYAEGKAALHIRASMALPGGAMPGARQYDASLNLGREGELFDQIRWRVELDFVPEAQLDLLVPLPPGQTSLQFAISERGGDGSAFLMHAFALPDTLPATTISPIYLTSAVTAGMRAEITRAPKKVNLNVPAELLEFIGGASLTTAPAGETVNLSFIYRGADFTELYLQLSQGTNQAQMAAQNLSQTPLADGLRIVRGSFLMPEWQAGKVEILIAAPIGDKVYRLGITSISIAQ